jgi:toxin HigB-1
MIIRCSVRSAVQVSALRELRIPPNNKLEVLSGERKGQHSIRINDQYRICFVWTDSGSDQNENKVLESIQPYSAL